MITITRLLLGLDTTPGSGYLCAVGAKSRRIQTIGPSHRGSGGFCRSAHGGVESSPLLGNLARSSLPSIVCGEHQRYQKPKSCQLPKVPGLKAEVGNCPWSFLWNPARFWD